MNTSSLSLLLFVFHPSLTFLTPSTSLLSPLSSSSFTDIYVARTGRKILMEYCLMEGVNSSAANAHELGHLLSSPSTASTTTLTPTTTATTATTLTPATTATEHISRNHNFLLNLIPYNDTSVDAKYTPPDRASVDIFVTILMSEYGVRTTGKRGKMFENVLYFFGFFLVFWFLFDTDSLTFVFFKLL